MMSRSGLQRYIEPNLRVLVVDDNRAIHDDFIKILTTRDGGRGELDLLHSELFGGAAPAPTEQFELDSAFQGQEAIERVKTKRRQGRPYALAFVDVRMPPGIDGVETAARLLEEDPEIGIVICSAYSDHSWEEMTARLGHSDRVLILKKPFDTIEVRQLAHALQKRWELARIVALKLGDLQAVVDEKTRKLATTNEQLKQEIAGREEALRQLAESNEQIRALAYEDGLTGLPNRRLFNEHLEKVLARARRKGSEFAVLFLDLDNFKLINDTLGHHTADALLMELAGTLNGLIRSEDVLSLYMESDIDLAATITLEPITDSVLSRMGGDEFIILLPDIKDRFAAGSVAHRILKRLERPLALQDQEMFVNASIGIATYPDDGQTSEALIRNADAAMYHAKQHGKAAYQYYSEEMNAASVERLTLEAGLRRALEDGDLELYYQPQIEVGSQHIVGAEVLLRWKHPQRGYVSPDVFVPIAEDTGLILAIGEWALNEACRQSAEWRRAGLPPIPIAINVSGVQFRRQNLYEMVRHALQSSGLEPGLLSIEITETAIISALGRAVELMQKLKDLGVGISLDDFGTGYSSLNYLKSFPISTLKIDRTFTSELLTDKRTASITAAIISMSQILGLRVVAEGVETAEQFELLKTLGCDAVQGYHFSAALPAREFARLLAGANTDAVRHCISL